MSMFQSSVLKSVSQDEGIVALYLGSVKEYTKAKKIKFADKLEMRNFKNNWKALFENDKKEVLEIQNQINQTDKEIDQMVYELDGLSDEEIKIVEGV